MKQEILMGYRKKIQELLRESGAIDSELSEDGVETGSAITMMNDSIRENMQLHPDFKLQIHRMLHKLSNGNTGEFEKYEEDLISMIENPNLIEGNYKLDKEYKSSFGMCNAIFIKLYKHGGTVCLYIFFSAER